MNVALSTVGNPLGGTGGRCVAGARGGGGAGVAALGVDVTAVGVDVAAIGVGAAVLWNRISGLKNRWKSS